MPVPQNDRETPQTDAQDLNGQLKHSKKEPRSPDAPQPGCASPVQCANQLETDHHPSLAPTLGLSPNTFLFHSHSPPLALQAFPTACHRWSTHPPPYKRHTARHATTPQHAPRTTSTCGGPARCRRFNQPLGPKGHPCKNTSGGLKAKHTTLKWPKASCSEWRQNPGASLQLPEDQIAATEASATNQSPPRIPQLRASLTANDITSAVQPAGQPAN